MLIMPKGKQRRIEQFMEYHSMKNFKLENYMFNLEAFIRGQSFIKFTLVLQLFNKDKS